MRHQIGMRIEGHEIHVADLRILHVTDDLPGHIIVLKVPVAELNQLPRDLTLKISAQIDIDRPDRGKGHATDHGSLGSIIQKSFLHPPAVPEFLRHAKDLSSCSR